MAGGLETTDRMVLAEVVDCLREEREPRSLDWIVTRIAAAKPWGGLTMLESVVQVPALWKRMFPGVAVRGARDRLRVARLVPTAVREGWLSDTGEGTYAATDAGREFSEREYRRCGEAERDDVVGAVDVCRVLAQAGRPLDEAALQGAAFPSNIGGAETAGLRAMLEARERTLPGRLRGALGEARRRGWIHPLAEGPTQFSDPHRAWTLTEVGRREGATFYDTWR